MRNNKHWFDRLPEIYQEIVMIEFNKFHPKDSVYKYRNLSGAFIWNDKYKDLFYGLFCELENIKDFDEYYTPSPKGDK